ncbi:MAG: serine/threonine protein kinase [Planctomycetota bacterium]|nr:serine/threonine protein kinase [Planctomycetota bacterium]
MSRTQAASLSAARRGAAQTQTGFIGSALAGPVAILILIPALVGGVGLFVTLTSFATQSRNTELAVEREFSRDAQQTADGFIAAMEQCEATLSALRSHMVLSQGEVDPSSFAHEMRAQMKGRPVVAYIGYGAENGDYVGVFVRGANNEREVVYTDRRMQPGGKTHLRESIVTDAGFDLFRDEPEYSYDPRTRPWYNKAVDHGDRIASDPYPWFDTGLIGVTIAEPFRFGGKRLGVIEVDVNLNTLSQVVEDLSTGPGGKVFVYTAQGEVLAFPGLRQQALRNQEGQGDVPMLANLDDPVVQAYLAGEKADRQALEVLGERFLAISRPVPVPGREPWRVVCVGSLDQRLAAARDSVNVGLIASMAALGLATVLALFFARHIVRTHVRVKRAEAEAERARKAARKIGGYHLYRILGEGGMGEVWLGEHGLLARPVAVKLVNAKFFGEMNTQEQDTTIGRFEREAKTLAQLRSRNTIDIYDFGVSDTGDLFYAMELLDGMDLYDLMEKHGPQPFARVIDILIQSARSLGEAHQRKLVHRDIKPANIYLCRMAGELDVIKVLDFGMVRRYANTMTTGGEEASNRLTIQGTIEGTPSYMAPEQVEDRKDVDGRADCYALALVGYYLLSGVEPFMRETPMKSCMAQLSDEPQPVSSLALQQIPPALDELLLRCLAKDSAQRPPSMAVFIEALQSIPIDSDRSWSARKMNEWWAQIPAADHDIGDATPSEARDFHRR